MKRLLLIALAGLALFAALGGPAAAQEYPIDVAPIRIDRPAATVPEIDAQPLVPLPPADEAVSFQPPAAPAQQTPLVQTGIDVTVGMVLAVALFLLGTALLLRARRVAARVA